MLTLLVTKEVFTLVTLKAESKIVDNVKGVIIFPENNEGPFRIELNLSTEQMKLFLDVYASSEDSNLIRMEAFGSNEKFISDKLFVKKYDILPSIHGLYRVLIYAYEVKRIISLPEPGANHRNITFWLNYSADIPGNDLVEKRYDGNVRVKAASEDYTTLIISDDLTFKFKRFYTYQNNENKLYPVKWTLNF